MKRKCKHDYFANEVSKYENNIKKTWNILNTLIGINSNKSRISDSSMIINKFTKDSNNIANKFYEYFSEIGHKFASKIPSPDK